jgi:hypothetical protein
MGAEIIDGKEAVGGPEKADLGVADRDATAFANRDVFQLESGVDIGHVGEGSR